MFEGDFSEWLPNASLTILYCLFVIAAFENQRWARARRGGMKGSSEAFGVFVDFTHLLSTVFRFGFLIALALIVGWQQALGLLVISSVTVSIYTVASTVLAKGDSLILWMLGTIAVWGLGPILIFQLIN